MPAAGGPADQARTGIDGRAPDDDTFFESGEARSLSQHVFFQASQTVSHEQAQALARIVLALLASVFLGGWALLAGTGAQVFPTLLAAGYAVLATGYYAWVRRSRRGMHPRRHAMMAADLGMTSYGNYVLGLEGLAFYPLYLWITIGNGFRFGPRALLVATALGLAGFLAATGLNGVLLSHTPVAVGLIIGLVLMPKFFLVMVNRLSDANDALRVQKDQAEYMATHDALTGLPNRTLLEDRLSRALLKGQRGGHYTAVAFLDLDGFKEVNDNFGHGTGDRLLIEVARCLETRVRRTDTVARLGGDEFIILLEDIGDPGDVAAFVDHLFQCSGRHYLVAPYQTFVTWSCGVAIAPLDGRDGPTLIKNADTAMYRAKSAGTNQLRLYDAAMSRQAAAQLMLREELRRAVQEDQFEVYYQPQVRLPEGEIIGAEALLRWRHPDRGLVGPDAFIEVAEHNGMIVSIGAAVLRKAIAEAAGWLAGGTPVRVHVNVSPHQLAAADFADLVQALLAEHQLPARYLGLEVTESAFIDDSDNALALFDQLRNLGILLSLDDFGTGYSSLAYLKRFPLDALKIDRSFVGDLPHDHNDCTLVEATLAIADHFGLEVIAEGVETDAQARWLQRRGCQHMQGYLLSRPVPVERFRQMLAAGGRLDTGAPGAPLQPEVPAWQHPRKDRA